MIAFATGKIQNREMAIAGTVTGVLGLGVVIGVLLFLQAATSKAFRWRRIHRERTNGSSSFSPFVAPEFFA